MGSGDVDEKHENPSSLLVSSAAASRSLVPSAIITTANGVFGFLRTT